MENNWKAWTLEEMLQSLNEQHKLEEIDEKAKAKQVERFRRKYFGRRGYIPERARTPCRLLNIHDGNELSDELLEHVNAARDSYIISYELITQTGCATWAPPEGFVEFPKRFENRELYYVPKIKNSTI